MDFHDPSHNADDLVFQGAKEYEPSALCDKKVLTALAAWRSRNSITEASPAVFHLDTTRCFTITYQGQVGGYWPDEDANRLGEGLLRDCLFKDGICALDDLEPRLIVANYKMQALADTEYLLVCPYPTGSGNIAGMVVVCVNRHLRPREPAA